MIEKYLHKKNMIYLGIGVFVLLVVLNSTKKVSLQEVINPEQKLFDSSSLPSFLRPPGRLKEGEQLPQTARPKANLSGLSLHKRFDT